MKHLNTQTNDHDSVVTGHGAHDRVVAFLPKGDEMYVRVDHGWKLGEPSVEQILSVARKGQCVKGKWRLDRAERWDDDSATDYYFARC